MGILHSKENQLRIIWRMIVHVLVSIVILIPFIFILKTLPLDSNGTGLESDKNLVFVLFLTLSFSLGGWVTLKWIDKRPPALLGLNFWLSSLRELLTGIVLGIVNFLSVLLILTICGGISMEWAATNYEFSAFAFSLGIYFLFAAIEEVINRGYLFQTLCEWKGQVVAAVIFSLIFSIVHIFNPDFTILAGVFLFVHGLLYSVAYLKTRSLWTPIGLHMAWNFAQGPLAGLKVSGTATGKSLFLTEVSGPEILTGGSFGVEGGLVAILVSICLLVLLIRFRWLGPSKRFFRIYEAMMQTTVQQAPKGVAKWGFLPFARPLRRQRGSLK